MVEKKKRAGPQPRNNPTTAAEKPKETKAAPALADTRKKMRQFPVVGIGASAGGLEALDKLFQKLTESNNDINNLLEDTTLINRLQIEKRVAKFETQRLTKAGECLHARIYPLILLDDNQRPEKIATFERQSTRQPGEDPASR